jgi:hypothetical protein
VRALTHLPRAATLRALDGQTIEDLAAGSLRVSIKQWSCELKQVSWRYV